MLVFLVWVMLIGMILGGLFLMNGLDRATAPRPAKKPPTPAPRVRPREQEQFWIDEWERRWELETGEVWGTIYTEDAERYRSLFDRYITDRMFGGRSVPMVVYGKDPFATTITARDDEAVFQTNLELLRTAVSSGVRQWELQGSGPTEVLTAHLMNGRRISFRENALRVLRTHGKYPLFSTSNGSPLPEAVPEFIRR